MKWLRVRTTGGSKIADLRSCPGCQAVDVFLDGEVVVAILQPRAEPLKAFAVEGPRTKPPANLSLGGFSEIDGN